MSDLTIRLVDESPATTATEGLTPGEGGAAPPGGEDVPVPGGRRTYRPRFHGGVSGEEDNDTLQSAKKIGAETAAFSNDFAEGARLYKSVVGQLNEFATNMKATSSAPTPPPSAAAAAPSAAAAAPAAAEGAAVAEGSAAVTAWSLGVPGGTAVTEAAVAMGTVATVAVAAVAALVVFEEVVRRTALFMDDEARRLSNVNGGLAQATAQADVRAELGQLKRDMYRASELEGRLSEVVELTSKISEGFSYFIEYIMTELLKLGADVIVPILRASLEALDWIAGWAKSEIDKKADDGDVDPFFEDLFKGFKPLFGEDLHVGVRAPALSI